MWCGNLCRLRISQERIESGLNEIQRGDATALYDAIYLASERLAGTSAANGRRRVIVLITDGGDTVKGSRYTQALEEAQRAGAMVYSIIIVPIYADAGRNTGGEHALIQWLRIRAGSTTMWWTRRIWSRRLRMCRMTCGRSICWGTMRPGVGGYFVSTDQGADDGCGAEGEV